MLKRKTKTIREIPSARHWTVEISVKSKAINIRPARIKRIVKSILANVKIPSALQNTCEISIVFTNDKEIQKLNKYYRNKDRPTDVLSFSQYENAAKGAISPSLGDLVISLDTTRKQAKEYGVTEAQELLRLIIHGILHLLGYNHEGVSRAIANRMYRKQKQIYSKLAKDD